MYLTIQVKKPLAKPQLTPSMTTASKSVLSQNIKTTETSDRKQKIANEIRSKVAAAQNSSNVASKPSADIKMPLPQQTEQLDHVTEQVVQVVKKPTPMKKPLSPMETYEMSDRGDSDSEESDYEEKEPKKKVSYLFLYGFNFYDLIRVLTNKPFLNRFLNGLKETI